MATTALKAAEYFLSKQSPEKEFWFTNLALQKLLYFAQGFHLALEGKPLFKDEIHAWKYGPVVPEVYRKYSKYKASPILEQLKVDSNGVVTGKVPPSPKRINPRAVDIIDQVALQYGQFSPWRLVELSHNEPPWTKAWNSDAGVIPQGEIKAHFLTKIRG